MSDDTPAHDGRPRILVYTDDPDRGGVAQYNHSILMGLVRAGYRVACAQLKSDGPLVESQRRAGIRHHWIPYTETAEKNFARALSDMAVPKAIFDQARPDLILFSDCCPMSNLGARQTAAALRIPFVVVVGFVAEYLASQFKLFVPVTTKHYALAREVIAVSEENLMLLRTRFGLGPSRGTVVYVGRPAEFFTPPDPARRAQLRAQWRIPQEAVLSLTTARFTSFKGYGTQLEAVRALADRKSLGSLHFAWLGEGEDRVKTESAIASLGLRERFTLPGHQWNIAAWLEAADLFVLPSELEGMPLSISEAMAKGLPVIASAVSGIPEQLGPTGKLLPDPKIHPKDTVRELAQTLGLWADAPEIRLEAGSQARQRARELFREETMVEKTLSIVAKNLPAFCLN